MPKRLTDEQRGPLSAWIVRQREARGWKQESMVGRLAEVGYGVRGDYYRQVEAGKKPGPDFLAALETLFGTGYVAPVEPEQPATQPAPTPYPRRHPGVAASPSRYPTGGPTSMS